MTASPPTADRTNEADQQPETTDFRLSEGQVFFFETFGCLVLRGLFAGEVERISRGFDEVFASTDERLELPSGSEYHIATDPAYEDQVRTIIPSFIDRSPDLAWLRTDPRLLTIAEQLLGPGYEYAESDGNRFNCDVAWHIDTYGSTPGVRHIKIYFYLDPLGPENGALRVLPGSHHVHDAFYAAVSETVQPPDHALATLGATMEEIPYWCPTTQPGDIIVGDFATFHASIGGAAGRRLFTVNFRAAG